MSSTSGSGGAVSPLTPGGGTDDADAASITPFGDPSPADLKYFEIRNYQNREITFPNVSSADCSADVSELALVQVRRRVVY